MGRRRRQSRRQDYDAPVRAALDGRVESGPDGRDYVVRPVPGARAAKPYRCPGCDQLIAVGVAHVVVWPAGGGAGDVGAGLEDRRHWHTPCWAHRADRRPTRRWS